MGQWKEAYEKLTSQYEEIQVIVLQLSESYPLYIDRSMHAGSYAVVGHGTSFWSLPAHHLGRRRGHLLLL